MLIAHRVLESFVLTARHGPAGARDTLKSILTDYGARPGLSPAVLRLVRLSWGREGMLGVTRSALQMVS